VDLGHVQADELWVKRVGPRSWMAMALAVPSRLWLGGVVSPHRDRALITRLVQRVRTRARSLAILVCVDSLASYVTAFLRVFRYPVVRGVQAGRSWLWSRVCSSAKSAFPCRLHFACMGSPFSSTSI
jgi:hypothetical protein